MRKIFIFSMALATSVLCPTTHAIAQNAVPPHKVPVVKKMLPDELRKERMEFQKTHGFMLSKTRTYGLKTPGSTVLPESKDGSRLLPQSKLASGKILKGTAKAADTDADKTILGVVVSDPNQGVYSFTPTNPPVFNPLIQSSSLQFTSGNSIITNDSVFHCLKNYFGSFLGYQEYNVYTGEMIDVPNSSPEDMGLVATDMAIDPQTNKVYGAFFNSSMSAMELGIMDYKTLTRTTIGSLSTNIQVLAIDSNGQMYGIGTDGNLYSIDKNSGAETLIGSTGVTVSSDGNSSYNQSGEIDPQTDIFYWASFDANANAALYTVDLTNGQATKISDMPNKEEIVGMSFPVSKVEGAPLPATNLATSFEGESTTGTISFTMPTQNTDNEAITGSLEYEIFSNGTMLADGEANAGDSVSAQVTASEGDNTFSVVVINGNGESQPAYISAWVGLDKPQAPTAVYAGATGHNITVSWHETESGIHGGFIGDITYDVLRTPDSVYVAQGLNGTSFTDELPAGSDLKAYKYTIFAKNSKFTSDGATSNSATAGDPLPTPYNETFDTQDDFNFYSVLDMNGDGETWHWEDGTAATSYPKVNNGGSDDWLISPEIHLEADHVYVFSMKVHGDGDTWPEQFQVLMGSEANPLDYNTVLIDNQNFGSKESKTFQTYISNKQDRNIRFAVHHNTPAGRNYFGRLYVEQFQITSGVDMAAPDSVKNLTVIPDANGALGATLSFNVPDKDVRGNDLTDIDKIVVTRGDSTIATLNNPAPGAKLTVHDDSLNHGNNSWTLVASNTIGEGLPHSISQFIGPDIPAPITGYRFADTNGQNWTAYWNKVSDRGNNGGYVNPDNVWYRLSMVVEGTTGGYALSNTLVDSIYNTQADVIDTYTADGMYFNFPPDDGDQDFQYFAIQAANEQGMTDGQMIQCIKGAPYSMPYRESFVNGNLKYNFAWISYSINGEDYLNVSTDMAADNDGGSLVWPSVGDGEYYDFNTGKIDLIGAQHPDLMFNYYAVPGADFTLKASAVTSDGTIEPLDSVDFGLLDGEAGWRHMTVSLDKFKDMRWLYIRFHLENNGDACTTALDNINVIDAKSNDLSVSMSAPQSINAGDVATVNLIIRNIGESTVNSKDYTVSLYNGDKLITTFDGQDLQSLDEQHITYNYTTSINQDANMPLLAVVSYDNDESLADNTDSVNVAVSIPDGITIDDLTGAETNNNVELTWTAPEKQEAKEVTEDFERYAPWSIGNLGRWTLYDGDGGTTGTFSNMPAFPNVNTPWAYIVLNPEKWGIDVNANPFMAAHSGSQYLTTFYAFKSGSNGDYYVNSDNWLISPKLSGKAQTISFYVRNLKNGDTDLPERFEVDYSTDGTTPNQFQRIGDNHDVSGGEWQQVSVDLPEGAQHFAIRHNTLAGQGFMFEVDDVTYTQAASAEITGYNIYRDGEKIATVGADATTYTDENVDGDRHVYNVTVIYADGESRYSNDALIDVTGIDSVTTLPDGKFDVYTTGGIRVKTQTSNLNGLRPGVYIVNGTKYVVR